MAVRTFRKITPSYQSISIITRNFTTAVSLFRKDHFPFSCIITRNFTTAVSPEKTDMPYAVNSTLSSAKKALSYSESPLETAENKKEATELISRNKCNIQEFCDSVLSPAPPPTAAAWRSETNSFPIVPITEKSILRVNTFHSL